MQLRSEAKLHLELTCTESCRDIEADVCFLFDFPVHSFLSRFGSALALTNFKPVYSALAHHTNSLIFAGNFLVMKSLVRRLLFIFVFVLSFVLIRFISFLRAAYLLSYGGAQCYATFISHEHTKIFFSLLSFLFLDWRKNFFHTLPRRVRLNIERYLNDIN